MLRDEPESGLTSDPSDYNHLDHVYTFDLPRTRIVGLAEQYQTVKVGALATDNKKKSASSFTS